MLSRDYILRQIHQLATVLSRVLFHRSNGQPEEAVALIDEAFQESPELAKLLRPDLSREDVLALCRTKDHFFGEKAFALADLLREKMLLTDGAAERSVYARYALWLYEAAQEQNSAAFPWNLQDRMAILRAEIRSPSSRPGPED